MIKFKLGIPSGDYRKLYTHVNMKNGEYLALARIDKIQLDFDEYLGQSLPGGKLHNGVLEMDAFNLDGIKVTVSGSMYDDR